jgi:hypothetical protein
MMQISGSDFQALIITNSGGSVQQRSSRIIPRVPGTLNKRLAEHKAGGAKEEKELDNLYPRAYGCFWHMLITFLTAFPSPRGAAPVRQRKTRGL